VASIAGQPSPKPQALEQPSPEAEAEAFLAQNPNFELPSPEDTQGDNFIAPSDQMQTDQQAYGGEFAPQPGFAQANVEQLQPENIKDRLIYGLAANDESAASAMRQKYGEKNVVVKGGKIYFRREDAGKFKPLDPDTLEVFADLIPDAARIAVQEATMAVPEALGGLAGAAAGLGGGSVPGAAVGARMGRIAAVPFATEAADFIAEKAGVPDVTNRNKLTENLVGIAAETFLPVVGKWAVSKIPGTLAYKASREAGERETVALTKQSREVVEAANRLNEQGIDAPLLLHQMQPDDPKIKKLLAQVADSPNLIDREHQIAEAYGQSIKNNLRTIAQRSGMGPADDPMKLASRIGDAVENVDRLEGEAIGRFKAKALAAAQGKKMPLPQKANQTVETMMRELGFVPRKSRLESITRREVMNPILEQTQSMGRKNEIVRTKWQPPTSMDGILGRYGITDPGQARAVVNSLSEYGDVMSRGGEVRLQDLDRLVSRMGAINPKLRGTEAGKLWGGLTAELRQHRRQVIGDLLPDQFEKQAFNNAMDEFSLIRQNVGDLQGVLGDNRSTKSIVNYFFQGKDNVTRIDALRTIVGKDSPQWGQLKEEFVNQLLTKHSTPDSKTGINSKALLSDLEKNYGEGFIRKVLDDGKAGPNFQTVKDLLTYGQRIEAAERSVKNVETASEEAKRGLVNIAIGSALALKGRMLSGAQSVLGAGSGRDRALFEVLNRDGIDKYVQNYPGKVNKAQVSGFLQSALDKYNSSKAGRIVNEIGARTMQGVGRNELMRDRSQATETQPKMSPEQ